MKSEAGEYRKIVGKGAAAAAMMIGSGVMGGLVAESSSSSAPEHVAQGQVQEIGTADSGTIPAETSADVVGGPVEFANGLTVDQQAELDITNRVAIGEYVDVAYGSTVRVYQKDPSTGELYYVDIVNPIISTVSRYDESSKADVMYKVVASRETGSDSSAARLVATYYPGISNVDHIVTLTSPKGEIDGLPKDTVSVPVKTEDTQKDASGNWIDENKGGNIYHFVVDASKYVPAGSSTSMAIPPTEAIGAAHWHFNG